MTKETKKISEENSYYSKMVISSISEYKKCLDEFSKNFEEEASLKTKTVIFLDTNILLRYYTISFTAREKFFNFLKENKERIIITPMVQTEFLRNREDKIQKFFEQVTSQIPNDFKSHLVNKSKSFLDDHKVVLKDYSFMEAGIEKHQKALISLLEKLNAAVEKKSEEHKDIVYKDRLLDFLATCKVCDPLNDKELKIVRGQFDILAEKIKNDSVDSVLNKPNFVFPGFGDIKKKPDDPYGDYIIFHEMMKYLLDNVDNAILLTFDITKGDWMKKDKSPHIHYVQNMYANTESILYILDAERSLGELLKVNIDSLVSSSDKYVSYSITKEHLSDLINGSDVFEGAGVYHLDDRIVEELHLNGYRSMGQIESDINSIKNGIAEYRKDKPGLNNLGVLRIGLRIANPNYSKYIMKNGVIASYPTEDESYEKYRKLD